MVSGISFSKVKKPEREPPSMPLHFNVYAKKLRYPSRQFASMQHSESEMLLGDFRQQKITLFVVEHVCNMTAHAQKPDLVFSAKWTGPFKLEGGEGMEGGGQFSRLLAAEVCASAVVMIVMLDTPCSEVQWKTTGYPLHSNVSPSLPLPCVTVCHHISTELYQKHEITRAVPSLFFSLVHRLRPTMEFWFHRS